MPVDSGHVQFSVRLTRREYDALRRKVERINASSNEDGLPGVVKLSQLASFYITEKLADDLKHEDEDRPPTKTLRPAADINHALAKLRGTRT